MIHAYCTFSIIIAGNLAVLSGIIVFGLLHEINPSHGWTIAVLYSIRSKRPLLTSILRSCILASAHFLSSIVVGLAFILFSTYIHIPHNFLNYAAAIALGILAYTFWKEKPEDVARTNMDICRIIWVNSFLKISIRFIFTFQYLWQRI